MNNNPNNPNTTISTDKLHKARGIIKISKAVNKEKKINYSLQIGGFLLFTSICCFSFKGATISIPSVSSKSLINLSDSLK